MSNIPLHVGIIPDGNRRWARNNSVDLPQAYRNGLDKIKMVTEHLFKLGVKYVTIYAFSAENMNRDESEKNVIFSLMKDYLDKIIRGEEKIPNVKFIGRLYALPKDLQQLMEVAEVKSKTEEDQHVFIGVAYGGQQEIVDAVSAYINDELDLFIEDPIETILDKIQKISKRDLDETKFSRYFYIDYTKVPYPALIIRTGGTHRMSNFLLYPAAYSEWYFIDTLWGDITTEEIDKAVNWFKEQKRNFGK